MKKFTKEDIFLSAEQYRSELQKEVSQLLNNIHQLQRQYNFKLRQLKGLDWFLDPEHEEAIDEIAVTKEYITDAKSIKDEIAEILFSVYPESLHYTEIMEKLEEKGYLISGKDPKQNLLSYLSRDERFVRDQDARGKYHINTKIYLSLTDSNNSIEKMMVLTGT